MEVTDSARKFVDAWNIASSQQRLKLLREVMTESGAITAEPKTSTGPLEMAATIEAWRNGHDGHRVRFDHVISWDSQHVAFLCSHLITPLRIPQERWHVEATLEEQNRVSEAFISAQPQPLLSQLKAAWHWTVEHPALILLLVGGASYGLLQYAATAFYGSFGLRLDEVGFSQVRLVKITLFAVGLFALFGMGLMFTLPLLFSIATRRIANRDEEAPRAEEAPSLGERILARNMISQFLLPAVTLVVLLFALGRVGSAHDVAEQDAIRLSRGVEVQHDFLPWTARRVQLYWKSPRSFLAVPGCNSLFLLGETDQTFVTFDSENGRTYTFPKELVTLSSTDFPQSVHIQECV